MTDREALTLMTIRPLKHLYLAALTGLSLLAVSRPAAAQMGPD